MKYYLSYICIMLLAFNPLARVTKGYVVAWNNDTTRVQVFLPNIIFGIPNYDLNKEIEITDSTGTHRVYFPRDIKAFGFQNYSKMILYRLKPVQTGTDLFLQGTILGNRVNLYEYKKDGSENIYFTVEKSNSYYLFLNSDEKVQTVKDKLKRYLRERPDFMSLIDSKFIKQRRIPEDLRDILNAFNN